MKQIFAKPQSMTDKVSHYCPGCTHGIAHRLVGETIDELGIADRTIGVASVGCSVLAYEYFDVDFQQASHGRAPAVATGIKRVHPESIVFTYQGDGDLASIGTAEAIHAAMRGENITIIFINNAIYGMTGGQMAPTTLLGQQTTTTPEGRRFEEMGAPIRMAEMLATLDGVAYVARFSLHDIPNITKAKRAIKKSFQYQLEGKGFTIVELLSTCPTNWGMSPNESLEWVQTDMMKVYPLGEFKTPEEGEKK